MAEQAKPVDDKPVDDKPVGEKPVEEKPAQDKKQKERDEENTNWMKALVFFWMIMDLAYAPPYVSHCHHLTAPVVHTGDKVRDRFLLSTLIELC